MTMPAFFHVSMLILLGATLVHLLCVMLFGQLPRIVGWVLVAAYGFFSTKDCSAETRRRRPDYFLKNCVSEVSSRGSIRN